MESRHELSEQTFYGLQEITSKNLIWYKASSHQISCIPLRSIKYIKLKKGVTKHNKAYITMYIFFCFGNLL